MSLPLPPLEIRDACIAASIARNKVHALERLACPGPCRLREAERELWELEEIERVFRGLEKPVPRRSRCTWKFWMTWIYLRHGLDQVLVKVDSATFDPLSALVPDNRREYFAADIRAEPQAIRDFVYRFKDNEFETEDYDHPLEHINEPVDWQGVGAKFCLCFPDSL